MPTAAARSLARPARLGPLAGLQRGADAVAQADLRAAARAHPAWRERHNGADHHEREAHAQALPRRPPRDGEDGGQARHRPQFTLSEPATVTLALQKAAKGQRAGGRCRKPTKALRKRKPCTRYVATGKLTRAGLAAGAQRVAFSGRIGRRALRPGRHGAVLRATDAAGNRSARTRLAFRIVRR